jgi:hypothetical protein
MGLGDQASQALPRTNQAGDSHCYNCRKMGNWAYECPDLTINGGAASPTTHAHRGQRRRAQRTTRGASTAECELGAGGWALGQLSIPGGMFSGNCLQGRQLPEGHQDASPRNEDHLQHKSGGDVVNP